MSGSLDNSPADVLRHLLVTLGMGTLPSAGGAWPINLAVEPDSPDSCITVFNTTNIQHGRSMIDGEVQEHHGVQIRIRAALEETAFAKADAIKECLDKTICLESVTIGSNIYLVYAVSKRGSTITLGKDPTSNRSLFTINAAVALRQTT